MSWAPTSVSCHSHLNFMITLQFGSPSHSTAEETEAQRLSELYQGRWVWTWTESCVTLTVLLPLSYSSSNPSSEGISLIFCGMIFRMGAVTVRISPSVGALEFDRDERGSLLSKPSSYLILQLGGSFWSTKGSSRTSLLSVGSVLFPLIFMDQQNLHLSQFIFYL